MPLALNDFVSPVDVVSTATAFLGSIDLDPASSEFAAPIVGAQKYFTSSDAGLTQTWKAKTLYLYPPRDVLTSSEQPSERWLFKKKKRFQKSAQRVWLEESIQKYKKGEFEEAIVFLTSTEVALLVTQKLELDLPMCVMKERPALLQDEEGTPRLSTPRCYGFIFYIPSPFNTEDRIHRFFEVFSELGRVYI